MINRMIEALAAVALAALIGVEFANSCAGRVTAQSVILAAVGTLVILKLHLEPVVRFCRHWFSANSPREQGASRRRGRRSNQKRAGRSEP